MLTEPAIIMREAQPCASIRVLVSIAELGSGIVPRLHDEVVSWLAQRGEAPAGAPFIRYRVIDMAAKLDVEMGWPTSVALKGDARVTCDVIPSGRYAVILYTGPYEGPGLMEANRVLIEWVRQTGSVLDNWAEERGDAFAARFEHYLTDPAQELDPRKWQTEVAIRLASG
jgi:effector-binding domain-containing protein